MFAAILAAIPAVLSSVAGVAGSLITAGATATKEVGSAMLGLGAGAASTIGKVTTGTIKTGIDVLGGLPAAVTGTVDYLGRIVEEKGPEIQKGIELYQKYKGIEPAPPPPTSAAPPTVTYVPQFLAGQLQPAYSAPGAQAPGVYAPAEPSREPNFLLYVMIAIVVIALLRKR